MLYYVSNNPQEPPQGNWEHEVHKETCSWLKLVKSKTYLGDCSSCWDAINKAKKHYSNVDGCKHCSLTCHTR